MGEANGSIPTVQPIMGKYMFGGFGKAIYSGSSTFVAQYAYENDMPKELRLEKKILPVRNCRQISKKDMIYNTWVPKIELDYKTYEVRANGELLTCAPAKGLPLTQRYFLF